MSPFASMTGSTRPTHLKCAAVRDAVRAALVMAVAALFLVRPAEAIPPDRGDLARGYQRFDALAVRAATDPATRRALSLGFDGLTADFFAGRYGRALAELARIEAEHARLDDRARAGLAFLAAHRFEVSPSIVDLAGIASATVRIRALPLDGAAPAGGLDEAPGTIVVSCGDFRAELAFGDEMPVVLGDGARPGPLLVHAVVPGIGPCEVARAWAMQGSIATRVEALRARAAALDLAAFTPSVKASLDGRIALLPATTVDRTRSATLLCDVARLLAELDTELDALARGSNPYARTGDLWRVYRALGVDLPTRQFVPDGAGPFPLVVAFHGAGGDENMFFDGYGSGMLRALARERGVAVVCPPTVPFGLSPALFDRFIDEVSKDMPVDRGRVLLLGHSMGAITASRLAGLRPDAIAGAACIAGFLDASRGGASAPRAVYLGALDPIFAIGPVREQVRAATRVGSPIELVEFEHEGHTLVVDRALPQAFEWLLARPARSTDTTKPTISAPSTRPMNTGVPAPAAIETSPSAGPRK